MKLNDLLKMSKMTSKGEWNYEVYYDRIDIYDSNHTLVAQLPHGKESINDADFICCMKKFVIEYKKGGDK